MATWHLRLLGALAITKDGSETFTRFRTHRSALLLAYLAVNPSKSFPREALGELLWPDDSFDKQRSRLKNEVSNLRRQFGHEIIEAEGATNLRCGPNLSCDVAEFRAALRYLYHAVTSGDSALRLKAAASLYRGDFLPGFYEEWVSRERDDLCERFQSIIDEILGILDKDGDPLHERNHWLDYARLHCPQWQRQSDSPDTGRIVYPPPPRQTYTTNDDATGAARRVRARNARHRLF